MSVYKITPDNDVVAAGAVCTFEISVPVALKVVGFVVKVVPLG